MNTLKKMIRQHEEERIQETDTNEMDTNLISIGFAVGMVFDQVYIPMIQAIFN